MPEPPDGTKNALVQNSRFAVTLRVLAASLARQGETNKAASVMRENLAIKPGLTLTKLRARLLFLSGWCWSRYSEGLWLRDLTSRGLDNLAQHTMRVIASPDFKLSHE
jgi:hypothetical protein